MKPTQYVELEVSSSTEEPQENSESCEDVVADPNVEESVAHRSGRVRQRPDYYVESVSCQNGLEEPTSYQCLKFERFITTHSTARHMHFMYILIKS